MVKLRTVVVACTVVCALACPVWNQFAFASEQPRAIANEEPRTSASGEPRGIANEQIPVRSVIDAGTTSGDIPITTRRKKLEKLKMATFTKYQARLLLPVQFEKRDKDNQLTVMGTDIPHGMYMFMSMRASEKGRLDAAAIKPIIKGTIEGMKADCEGETPLKLGEYEGLQCRGRVRVDADVEAIVRGYVAERRMYFVTAVGTGPWIRSNAVTRYLDSFEITR